MSQVLFWLPGGIPIYGFGTMLFLTFLVTMWYVGRRCDREGIPKDRVQDAALLVFLSGILGARIVYMIQYKVPLQDFYKIWEGGIVFYGSAIGGWIGYGLAHLLILKRHQIRTWKLADLVAPAVALGLAIGRVGCFLNGCCYGHISTNDGVRFPLLTSPARDQLVGYGFQTGAGFAMKDGEKIYERTVGMIEPDSAASRAGLRSGDVIERINGVPVENYARLFNALYRDWPQGITELRLTVRRGQDQVDVAFTPRTLPLYPTQVFESISMALLFFVLVSAHPYKRFDGQIFIMMMMGYAVHRFFNETLRTDTEPVLSSPVPLTLSQTISLAVLMLAIGLGMWLRTQSRTTGGSIAKANGGA
jgi:prolipoprotein diacylglyceryltransferase